MNKNTLNIRQYGNKDIANYMLSICVLMCMCIEALAIFDNQLGPDLTET